MGVDNIVLFPAHERGKRAHIGKRGPLLRNHEYARARLLNLCKQTGLHCVWGGKVRFHARRAQAGQPLQGKHGDAVARHRHGEYMQNAHQSRASSAESVWSYLPVFCAS